MLIGERGLALEHHGIERNVALVIVRIPMSQRKSLLIGCKCTLIRYVKVRSSPRPTTAALAANVKDSKLVKKRNKSSSDRRVHLISPPGVSRLIDTGIRG